MPGGSQQIWVISAISNSWQIPHAFRFARDCEYTSGTEIFPHPRIGAMSTIYLSSDDQYDAHILYADPVGRFPIRRVQKFVSS